MDCQARRSRLIHAPQPSVNAAAQVLSCTAGCASLLTVVSKLSSCQGSVSASNAPHTGEVTGHCPSTDHSTSDMLVQNARLVGLWLELLAVGVSTQSSVHGKLPGYITDQSHNACLGAYVIHLPQCVSILRKKVREGASLWLPGMCLLFFITTLMVCLLSSIIRLCADDASPRLLFRGL